MAWNLNFTDKEDKVLCLVSATLDAGFTEKYDMELILPKLKTVHVNITTNDCEGSYIITGTMKALLGFRRYIEESIKNKTLPHVDIHRKKIKANTKPQSIESKKNESLQKPVSGSPSKSTTDKKETTNTKSGKETTKKLSSSSNAVDGQDNKKTSLRNRPIVTMKPAPEIQEQEKTKEQFSEITPSKTDKTTKRQMQDDKTVRTNKQTPDSKQTVPDSKTPKQEQGKPQNMNSGGTAGLASKSRPKENTKDGEKPTISIKQGQQHSGNVSATNPEDTKHNKTDQVKMEDLSPLKTTTTIFKASGINVEQTSVICSFPPKGQLTISLQTSDHLPGFPQSGIIILLFTFESGSMVKDRRTGECHSYSPASFRIKLPHNQAGLSLTECARDTFVKGDLFLVKRSTVFPACNDFHALEKLKGADYGTKIRRTKLIEQVMQSILDLPAKCERKETSV